jgi:hypothetical protein
MKKIFSDYKWRLTTLDSQLAECRYDISVQEILRRENLRWKAEVYRTFFHKIQKLKSELIAQSRDEVYSPSEDVNKFNLN